MKQNEGERIVKEGLVKLEVEKRKQTMIRRQDHLTLIRAQPKGPKAMKDNPLKKKAIRKKSPH